MGASAGEGTSGFGPITNATGRAGPLMRGRALDERWAVSAADLAAREVMVREMMAPVPAGLLPQVASGSPAVICAVSRRAVSAICPLERLSMMSAPLDDCEIEIRVLSQRCCELAAV